MSSIALSTAHDFKDDRYSSKQSTCPVQLRAGHGLQNTDEPPLPCTGPGCRTVPKVLLDELDAERGRVVLALHMCVHNSRSSQITTAAVNSPRLDCGLLLLMPVRAQGEFSFSSSSSFVRDSPGACGVEAWLREVPQQNFGLLLCRDSL